jgi:hypothetical protein
LELPKTTAYGRIIAKDKLFEHGGASRELQDIVAKQVGRIRWANKIAPGTMNIAPDDEISEIELIEMELRVPLKELDKRIMPLVVKAIPYNLFFKLVGGEKAHYAVIYGGKAYHSEIPPKIIGSGTKSVWENIVRQVAGIPFGETPIADVIAENERIEKLTQQIETLERKARAEKQPRRKLDIAIKIKRLKELL